jgi:hypothetical protein
MAGTPWDFGEYVLPIPSVHANKSVLTTNPDRFMSWDVTADVQAFVNGTVPNNGWLLKDRIEDKATSYRTDWVARENTSTPCGTPSTPHLLVETSTGTILTLAAEADAGLEQGNPNANRGTVPLLALISRAPALNWRLLVRINLASIPAGTTIRQANLRLCLDSLTGDSSRRVYEAYRVTTPWVENQVTANRASTGVPWDFGDFE